MTQLEREPLDDPRDRLLDATLEQMFARHDVAAPARAPAGRRTWLAAAALMLGVGVVAASMWWGDGRRDAAANGQDPTPAPMPAAVRCLEPGSLERAPLETEHLVVALADPGDLRELVRFTRLRRLTLVRPDAQRRPAWGAAAATPDVLAPLLELARLEELQLPSDMAVTPDHVRALARHPKLRDLALPGAFPSTPDGAAALRSLPHLRALRLSHVTVHDGFLEALTPVGLTTLALDACPVPDASTYGELAALDTVAALAVRFCSGYAKDLPELSEPAFEAFEDMDALVDLDLDETNFADALMGRLPVTLRRLRLGDHVMRPETIAALDRLVDLRDLSFHPGKHRDAAARLVRVLRLTRLRLRCTVDRELIDAIGESPTLEHVHMRLRGKFDLRMLRAAPRLRRLEIEVDPVLEAIEPDGPGVDPTWEDPIRYPEQRSVLADLVAAGVTVLVDGKAR